MRPGPSPQRIAAPVHAAASGPRRSTARPTRASLSGRAGPSRPSGRPPRSPARSSRRSRSAPGARGVSLAARRVGDRPRRSSHTSLTAVAGDPGGPRRHQDLVPPGRRRQVDPAAVAGRQLAIEPGTGRRRARSSRLAAARWRSALRLRVELRAAVRLRGLVEQPGRELVELGVEPVLLGDQLPLSLRRSRRERDGPSRRGGRRREAASSSSASPRRTIDSQKRSCRPTHGEFAQAFLRPVERLRRRLPAIAPTSPDRNRVARFGWSGATPICSPSSSETAFPSSARRAGEKSGPVKVPVVVGEDTIDRLAQEGHVAGVRREVLPIEAVRNAARPRLSPSPSEGVQDRQPPSPGCGGSWDIAARPALENAAMSIDVSVPPAVFGMCTNAITAGAQRRAIAANTSSSRIAEPPIAIATSRGRRSRRRRGRRCRARSRASRRAGRRRCRRRSSRCSLRARSCRGSAPSRSSPRRARAGASRECPRRAIYPPAPFRRCRVERLTVDEPGASL